jgi:hypothetical protein
MAMADGPGNVLCPGMQGIVQVLVRFGKRSKRLLGVVSRY